MKVLRHIHSIRAGSRALAGVRVVSAVTVVRSGGRGGVLENENHDASIGFNVTYIFRITTVRVLPVAILPFSSSARVAVLYGARDVSWVGNGGGGLGDRTPVLSLALAACVLLLHSS